MFAHLTPNIISGNTQGFIYKSLGNAAKGKDSYVMV